MEVTPLESQRKSIRVSVCGFLMMLMYVMVNGICDYYKMVLLCCTSCIISSLLLTMGPVKWLVKSFTVPEFGGFVENPTVTYRTFKDMYDTLLTGFVINKSEAFSEMVMLHN